MPYAIVISVAIASVAYLIPRLATLKVNLDQLKLMGEARVEPEYDTVSTGNGEVSYTPYS